VSLSFNLKDWNTDGAGPRMNVGSFPETLRGITIQTYLAEVPGKTPQARRATLLAAMKQWKALGVVGWAPHGFTTTMGPSDVAAYVDMARQAGLACVPAFGLNEDDPRGKGDRIALVARVPGVVAVLLDAEGAWEGHPAQFDADAAVAMGAELTAAAPGVVLIHQPWSVPQVHREYPQVAFTRFASANAPQFYANPYKPNDGERRVRVRMPMFEANWTALERDVLAPSGVGGVPRIETVESYGYSDGKALYDYTAFVVAHETLVEWSEWQPDASGLHALEARQRIDQAVGLRVGGAWSGADAVRRFQAAYNARTSKPIAVDGAYGPETDRALFGSGVTRFFRSLFG
jgi:hypothetical protein